MLLSGSVEDDASTSTCMRFRVAVKEAIGAWRGRLAVRTTEPVMAATVSETVICTVPALRTITPPKIRTPPSEVVNAVVGGREASGSSDANAICPTYDVATDESTWRTRTVRFTGSPTVVVLFDEVTAK